MDNTEKKLTGKKAIVIGMGRSGRGAASMLHALGADIDLYDAGESDASKEFAESVGASISFGERPACTEGYDLAVVSPGVPVDKDFIAEITANGAELIGELELAYRFGKGEYVAITGTNGKTTTTTLTGEIFKAAGIRAELAGNIGIAVTEQAAAADDETVLVTECSSFQLETVRSFRPHVSALLNITPDHLDRHKTMENYAAAKSRIYMNQGKDDYFIYNLDDELTAQYAEGCSAVKVPFSRKRKPEFGAYVDNEMIVIRDENGVHEICGVSELLIPGPHNLENALAAAAMAYFYGIEPSSIASALKRFKGVAHRIEDCGTVNGIKYVNDSKGTNPDAAIKAVLSFENIVLIAGGYDKGASYEEFIGSFGNRVKAMVLLGATAPKIRAAAEKAGFTDVYDAENMREAVLKCTELAEPGDVVLLSPACASWGMYPNFEVRGDDFRSIAQELAAESAK